MMDYYKLLFSINCNDSFEDIAYYYANLYKKGKFINWEYVNNLILNKWNEEGLNKIKEIAWKNIKEIKI